MIECMPHNSGSDQTGAQKRRCITPDALLKELGPNEVDKYTSIRPKLSIPLMLKHDQCSSLLRPPRVFSECHSRNLFGARLPCEGVWDFFDMLRHSSGICQGYSLSLFLYTAVMTMIMEDGVATLFPACRKVYDEQALYEMLYAGI